MPQEPKTRRCVEVSSLCFDENHAENVSRVPCELWSSHEQCGSHFGATSPVLGSCEATLALLPNPKRMTGHPETIGIDAGRPSFECEQVAVANVTDTRKRYLAAAPGESVRLVLNCVKKCCFIYRDQTSVLGISLNKVKGD
jgi:hypothetical protein